MFRYTMLVAPRDSAGVRWPDKVKVSVLARAKEDAVARARAALEPAPDGTQWALRLLEIEEVAP